MHWRFAEFRLDEDRRELKLRDREMALQPRVLDVLLHLVCHRDRVVPKDELLETVWPDAIVTESSLQRAISLARAALREGGLEEAIRSYPRRGYRFCPEVDDTSGASTVGTPSEPVGSRVVGTPPPDPFSPAPGGQRGAPAGTR